MSCWCIYFYFYLFLNLFVVLIFEDPVELNSYMFTFFSNNFNRIPLHCHCISGYCMVFKSTGLSASKHVPLWELLWFLIVANMSITGMSLRLMLNSVGFYQMRGDYRLKPFWMRH
ncbi:hypothetical protein MKW98_010072 [Papaver atlanticum]|uniref:Uncharacterized protein n=1 Tax=Papaver atlanticum TaxID=357466 RepID=A0AAD4RXR1_9MAGN|nr:hypothetical protein MKW98_010072 [Papaver atlanticum]